MYLVSRVLCKMQLGWGKCFLLILTYMHICMIYYTARPHPSVLRRQRSHHWPFDKGGRPGGGKRPGGMIDICMHQYVLCIFYIILCSLVA